MPSQSRVRPGTICGRCGEAYRDHNKFTSEELGEVMLCPAVLEDVTFADEREFGGR